MARPKKTIEQKLKTDLVDGDISYKGEEITIAQIAEAIAMVEADLAVAAPGSVLVGYHPITGEAVYI